METKTFGTITGETFIGDLINYFTDYYLFTNVKVLKPSPMLSSFGPLPNCKEDTIIRFNKNSIVWITD